MKRSKKLIALLAVLLVLCVATFAVMQIEEQKEQIKTSGEIVLEVSSDDVQSLSWEYGKTSLAFHKDEGWVYDEDEAFPVDEEKIAAMLEQFESFGVSFVIEEVTDDSVYGLDDPVCTITFATAEQTYTVRLGDFSKIDEERYVSIGDGNVYLAKHDPLDEFDAVLKDMIKHDEDLSYERITQIKFEGAENYTIFYEEDSTASYCAEDVYFTEKDGEKLPLDTSRIGSWLEYLTTLNPTDYVTYNVTDEELESFGMTTPELTITVDYTAEDADGEEVADTFVLSVSRDPEELAAADKAEANDEDPEDVTAYIRIGKSQIIYRISEYKSNGLRAVSYNELRHREVLPADFEDIYQVDVTLEDSDYTIAVDGEKDNERIWKYQEEEVEIDDLQNALETLDVEYSGDFITDKPSGKKEISLAVYLDNENHPKVEIELYRHGSEDCLAVVDGETLALVPRSDVVDLIEAVYAIILD